MPAIRSLAEHLSRNVVLKRRLPRDLGRGTLYVSPGHGGLRFWKPTLRHVDPPLLEMARELVRSGDSIWDIGANVGLFTFSAAHLAGPGGFVLAVEPDVENASLLMRSRRRMNRASSARVDVLTAAIAAPGARVAQFAIATRSRSANALVGFGSTQMGGQRETRPVPTLTLDELAAIFPIPRIVKIDVEGAEMAVLEGSSRLLSAHRPILLLEVAPANSLAMARLLRSRGYQVQDGDLPAEQRQPLDSAPWNSLALPA
jgi:FkbM family methyltransferase